jgi:hypothetical protein
VIFTKLSFFTVVVNIAFRVNNGQPEQSDLLSMRERVTGIEPALSAWEADVLPLNYTRTHGRIGAQAPHGVPTIPAAQAR